jgi:hypothetical protein
VHCERPESVARIEAGLKAMTGQTWSLRIEQDRAASPAAPVAPVGPAAGAPKRSPREEAQKIPIVKRAVEVFGATIQRVDDDFGETAGPTGAQAEQERG